MDEQNTSADQKKRILVFDRKEAAKEALQMITTHRLTIKAINEASNRHPENSEVASAAIKSCKESIKYYANQIRRIRNGETKLY